MPCNGGSAIDGTDASPRPRLEFRHLERIETQEIGSNGMILYSPLHAGRRRQELRTWILEFFWILDFEVF